MDGTLRDRQTELTPPAYVRGQKPNSLVESGRMAFCPGHKHSNLWPVIVFFAAIIALTFNSLAQSQPSEYELKAAFLFNFAKFVEWPPDAFAQNNSPIVVGILGKNVYSAANEDMGRVVDVIVKRTGEVRAAVIDFGGFLGVGSRTIAVDWSALRFPTSGPMDHIILELTRDQVRLAPEYKPGEPLVVLGLGDVQLHPETPAPEH